MAINLPVTSDSRFRSFRLVFAGFHMASVCSLLALPCSYFAKHAS